MRSAITRAVEEINREKNLNNNEVSPNEEKRHIKINLSSLKTEILIEPYTEKKEIKKLIRKALKDNKDIEISLSQPKLIN